MGIWDVTQKEIANIARPVNIFHTLDSRNTLVGFFFAFVARQGLCACLAILVCSSTFCVSVRCTSAFRQLQKSKCQVGDYALSEYSATLEVEKRRLLQGLAVEL